jgi:hypothetical protein
MLTLVDEFTRESLCVETRGSIKSRAIVSILSKVMDEHGVPAYLRSDNGPELVAHKVKEWLAAKGTQTLTSRVRCHQLHESRSIVTVDGDRLTRMVASLRWGINFHARFGGCRIQWALNTAPFFSPQRSEATIFTWRVEK